MQNPEDPIERTQTLSLVRLFTFPECRYRCGCRVEAEFRRELFRDFRAEPTLLTCTQRTIAEGGGHTNAQRSLQQELLPPVNADISYAPKFKNDTQLTATLLYNLQGPRIHAVGISGLGRRGNREDLYTLDFSHLQTE